MTALGPTAGLGSWLHAREEGRRLETGPVPPLTLSGPWAFLSLRSHSDWNRQVQQVGLGQSGARRALASLYLLLSEWPQAAAASALGPGCLRRGLVCSPRGSPALPSASPVDSQFGVSETSLHAPGPLSRPCPVCSSPGPVACVSGACLYMSIAPFYRKGNTVAGKGRDIQLSSKQWSQKPGLRAQPPGDKASTCL